MTYEITIYALFLMLMIACVALHITITDLRELRELMDHQARIRS